MVTSDHSPSAPRQPQMATLGAGAANNDTSNYHHPLTATQPVNSRHRQLNAAWQEYFHQATAEPSALPICANNLQPDNNILPWGPDAHNFLEEETFRVVWQNHNGFQQTKDALPSWVATMDFLRGLKVSLSGFTEPNLQWDGKLLLVAKDCSGAFSVMDSWQSPRANYSSLPHIYREAHV
jgi:hypothetical protein